MAASAGGYEDVLAIVTLVVGMGLVVLFLSNSRLYPLAQREPLLVSISNLAHTLVVAMWLFEVGHPEILFIHRKIVSQLCLGFLVIPCGVRVWKVFLDAGITNERVQAKVGWFINHRHYRSRSNLYKIAAALGCIQVVLCILSIFAEPQYNFIPAREGALTTNDALVVHLPLTYWLIFLVFSLLIAKTKDGFFMKLELALVGTGAFTFTLLNQSVASNRMPCSVPGCAVLLAWFGWLWMLGCSIGLPLLVARRNPRFEYARCFKCSAALRELRSRSSGPSSRSSTFEGEFPSFHDSHCEVQEIHEMSHAQLDRLKDVPLATFLTYPAGKAAFRAFTVREFSVENLLFIEAVTAFRNNPAPTKADFQVLYDQYIPPAAPNQVNLPSSVMQSLQARLQQPGRENLNTYFDEASKHIMKLLQRDAYKRFQHTVEWQQHVAVFDIEPKQIVVAKVVPVSVSETSEVHSTPQTAERSIAGDAERSIAGEASVQATSIEHSPKSSPSKPDDTPVECSTTPIFDFVPKERTASHEHNTPPRCPTPTQASQSPRELCATATLAPSHGEHATTPLHHQRQISESPSCPDIL